jgi:hypothetical protein
MASPGTSRLGSAFAKQQSPPQRSVAWEEVAVRRRSGFSREQENSLRRASCTVGRALRQRQSRAGAVALSRSGGKDSAGALLRAHAMRSEAMTAISTARTSESTVSADANEPTTATARQPAAPARRLRPIVTAIDDVLPRRVHSTIREMSVRPRRGSRSLRRRAREDGRCPARTGDLLLVRQALYQLS